MHTYINKNDLVSFFQNHQCDIIETRGTREGLIIKFKTFYLKIYNGNSNNYMVGIYRYGCNRPCRVDEVKENKMREYASQFAE